jgi:hypothetical protein
MDRWRATPTEVARTLLVVMRRGSLSAAEEITGHQVETIRRWLRAAARHAEALTEVLVHDLHLSEVEVDAFGSFVKELISKPGCPIVVYFVSGQPAWEGKADGVSGVDG